MGAQINSSSRKRKRSYTPLSEINVTPFVDVMLVLLVVFMVTAPLLTSGVKVDLPKSTANRLEVAKEPAIVTLDDKGNLFVKDKKVTLKNLVQTIEAQYGDASEKIYIRGDKKIAYGKIMQVMGVLTKGGFEQVGLISEKEKK